MCLILERAAARSFETGNVGLLLITGDGTLPVWLFAGGVFDCGGAADGLGCGWGDVHEQATSNITITDNFSAVPVLCIGASYKDD